MATLNHNHLKHAMILVKGAPEQILKMCQNQQTNWGEIQPLNEMYWKEQMEKIATRGQRVLAFAITKAKLEHTVLEFADVEGSLTLLGMVDLIDPPRPESITADAEIAMGKKGSEVAKEAAEFILTDDNFASIVAAVREGRTVYDNLKKVISWTLPTNAGEAMTIILVLLLGLSLPVTAIQILWINLITAVTLGLALAFEPTEEGTMHRPPRPRSEPLLTGSLVWHIILVSILFICGVFGLYFYALDRGYSLELARTIALNTLIVVTGAVFFAMIKIEKQLRLRISTIRLARAGENTLYGDKIL